MANVRLIVAPIDDHWVVSGNNGYRQAYEGHAQAIRGAVEAAHWAGESGDHAEVLGLDHDNRLYPIWTYGHDGFVPPREGSP